MFNRQPLQTPVVSGCRLGLSSARINSKHQPMIEVIYFYHASNLPSIKYNIYSAFRHFDFLNKTPTLQR